MTDDEMKDVKAEVEQIRNDANSVIDDLQETLGQAEMKLSEQSQRITNLIEVKDNLYYRCEQLEEALRSLHKALNDSDKKYPDWVGTKELYDAFKESESILSPPKE